MCSDVEEDCPSNSSSYRSSSFGSTIKLQPSKDRGLQSINENDENSESVGENASLKPTINSDDYTSVLGFDLAPRFRDLSKPSTENSNTFLDSEQKGKRLYTDSIPSLKEHSSPLFQIEKGIFDSIGPKEIWEVHKRSETDRNPAFKGRNVFGIHQNVISKYNTMNTAYQADSDLDDSDENVLKRPKYTPTSDSRKPFQCDYDIETDEAPVRTDKTNMDTRAYTKSSDQVLMSTNIPYWSNKNTFSDAEKPMNANLNSLRNSVSTRRKQNTLENHQDTIVLRLCNSKNDNDDTQVLTSTSDTSVISSHKTSTLELSERSRRQNPTNSIPEPKTDNLVSPETRVLEPYKTGSTSNPNRNVNSTVSNLNTIDTVKPDPYDEIEYLSRNMDSIVRLFDLESFFKPNGEGDSIIGLGIINLHTAFVLDLLTRVTEQSILDIPNRDGNTILHLATIVKQDSIVRRLIILGADVTAQNIYGNTALHIASMYGFVNCARALTEPIKPIEVKYRRYYTPYQRIPQRQDVLNYDGFSCLHLACKYNYVNIIDHLLYDCGANVNIQDGTSGMTILHYAAIENDFALVRYLLTIRNADINAMRYDNATPLALARGRNNLRVMEVLQEHGAIDIDNDDVIDDVMYEYIADEDGDCVMMSEMSRQFEEMNVRNKGSVFYDDVQIAGSHVG